MKRKKIFSIVAIGLMLMTFAGCEADLQPDYSRVYIGQAVESRTMRIMFESTASVDTTLSIKLVKPQVVPVTLKLGVDTILLKSYNAQSGANYEPLPEDYFNLVDSIVLEAGQSNYEIPVSIKYFSEDIQYALPLSIMQVEGPVQAAVSSAGIIMLLDKPLIQDVPEWTARSAPETGHTTNPWNVTTKDWSIETWVWMSAFEINNQAIINMNASSEIYIRFGDTSIPYNSIQVKCGGSQVNNPTLFEPQRWYHLAFVYTQAAKKLQIYVDGKPTGQLVVDVPQVELDGIQLVSSGEAWFWARCRMAQLRVWTRALSETEINTNKAVSISPTSNGLLGYWKLNEGANYGTEHPEINWDGRTFFDSTPNGYHLKLAQYGNVTWIEDGFKAGK